MKGVLFSLFLKVKFTSKILTKDNYSFLSEKHWIFKLSFFIELAAKQNFL